MPELPEIETIRRITGPLMIGRTIKSSQVLYPKIVREAKADDFVSGITGKKITEVGRRAKILLIYLSDGSHLVMRFGMTGTLLSVPQSDPVHKYARVCFDLDDGTRIEFRDMRLFGRIWHIPADVEDTVSGIGGVGIEPYDHSLDGRFLEEHMGGSTRCIKTALLDQSIVCGLGNIYSDEVLWRSRICPETPCNELKKKDWKAVAEHIPEVLTEAIEGNFVPSDEFVTVGGVEYRYRDFDAYGREGKPCKRCGTEMIRSVLNHRSSVWCPRCQKKVRSRTHS